MHGSVVIVSRMLHLSVSNRDLELSSCLVVRRERNSHTTRSLESKSREGGDLRLAATREGEGSGRLDVERCLER